MTKSWVVSFITLGCAKNEVDSKRMAKSALEAGFQISEDPSVADAVVVNTCSFIQSATEESIEAIFDAAALPNVKQGGALIVAGCMPARYGEGLESELSEACAFVPCSKEDDIAKVLKGALGLSKLPCEENTVPTDNESVYAQDDSVFAYVKISDGCNRFCTYCTIPFIRGRYHSFTYDDIFENVRQEVAQGKKEIVLIAQDTGRWGDDFEHPLSLAWLVDHLAKAFPTIWFRVMYIQPEGITDALLDVYASNDNVCSYFDIPIQHVNSDILAAMNRKGSRKDFIALCQRIRQKVPDACLRTTLIAGFPGETDQDFEELCDFVSEGLFDYVGVFAYSREEGTKAYKLPYQVPEDEKSSRAQQLRDLADAACTPNISSRIGKKMDILVEGVEEDGQVYGRAMCQAPEVDGVTYVATAEVSSIVSVTITDTLMYEMEGE